MRVQLPVQTGTLLAILFALADWTVASPLGAGESVKQKPFSPSDNESEESVSAWSTVREEDATPTTKSVGEEKTLSSTSSEPSDTTPKLPLQTTCKVTPSGWEYIGKLSVTKQGYECNEWANYPFMFSSMKSAKDARNYCRNPDLSPKGPWCYTGDEQQPWDYCQVEYCEGAQGNSTPASSETSPSIFAWTEETSPSVPSEPWMTTTSAPLTSDTSVTLSSEGSNPTTATVTVSSNMDMTTATYPMIRCPSVWFTTAALALNYALLNESDFTFDLTAFRRSEAINMCWLEKFRQLQKDFDLSLRMTDLPGMQLEIEATQEFTRKMVSIYEYSSMKVLPNGKFFIVDFDNYLYTFDKGSWVTQ